MYIYRTASIAGLACILWGCATTQQSQVDPSAVRFAELRNEQRSLQSRVSAQSDSIDDLQARLTHMQRENQQLQEVLRQEFSKMRQSTAATERSREDALRASMAKELDAYAEELQRMNNRVGEVVSTVQQQNTALRQQIVKDITTLQNDIKAIKIQVNAFMDKTDRLERQIDAINAAGVARTPRQTTPTQPATTTTPARQPAPAAQEELIRTGTPSHSSIDYSRGYNHTIVRGETLWQIARDYNVAVQDIVNTNPDITSSTTLRPGQVVFVPYRATE